jgi:uncharacterized oligopeptide transporter (OPT) family protein
MATLAQGVMEGNLPWALLLLGAGLALAAEAAGIPSLPFAIGLYLPVTTTTGLVCGGLVASFRKPAATADSRTLLASGMIAGDALVGILLAGIVVAGWAEALRWRAPGDGLAESLLTVGAFFALLLFFLRAGRTSERVGAPAAG